MSIKLKALGLGLIAALAMSAMAVVNASAEEEKGGHFVSSLANGAELKVTGVDEEPTVTHFVSAWGTTSCKTLPVYHAVTTSNTVEELTVTPTYENCETSEGYTAHINMHGCTYKFTVRKAANTKHSTVHLGCPTAAGPTITVTGPGGTCRLEVTANQTPTKGVVYTNQNNTPHDVTVDVTATGIHTVRAEGGFFQCGNFTTTDAAAELTGQVTVRGFNAEGKQVPVTAT